MNWPFDENFLWSVVVDEVSLNKCPSTNSILFYRDTDTLVKLIIDSQKLAPGCIPEDRNLYKHDRITFVL